MSTNMSTPTPEKESKYKDVLIEGHEYDGIQEYDNPMPRWWLWTFYVTIIWSGLYVVGISFGFVNTYEDDLQKESAYIDELQRAAQLASPEVTPEYLAGLVGDDAVVARGQQAYAMSCAACHGARGEGGIGSNLADDYWIHGGTLTDIYNIIEGGAPAKGMPPWGGILSQDDIVGLTIYIDTLRGTNPPNGKGPEGELYER